MFVYDIYIYDSFDHITVINTLLLRSHKRFCTLEFQISITNFLGKTRSLKLGTQNFPEKDQKNMQIYQNSNQFCNKAAGLLIMQQ